MESRLGIQYTIMTKGKGRKGKGKSVALVGSSKGLKNAPVAMTRKMVTGQPLIQNLGSQAICVKHKEYFADVTSVGTAFAVSSSAINPGIPTLFKWLAPIAQRYETYQWKKLCFSYETMASTATVGTVIMAVDYDASDIAPTSKIDVMSYKDAVRTAPWASTEMRCQVSDLNKVQKRYVRAGAVASTDIKTYDTGNFLVCLDGVGAATVGELYAEYEVILSTPQVSNGIGGQTSNPTATDEAAAAWFGTNGLRLYGGILPGAVTSASTFTFSQPFEGQMPFILTGTVMSADVALNGTATSSVTSQIVNAGATSVTGFAKIKAATGQTIAPSLTATTLTNVILYFTSVPYAVV